MSRWLLNLLSVALVASILAAVPLAYRAYEPVHKNNRAVEAMREHKYDEAIALLSEAMLGSPDNKVFRENLVAAYNSKAIELEKGSGPAQPQKVVVTPVSNHAAKTRIRCAHYKRRPTGDLDSIAASSNAHRHPVFNRHQRIRSAHEQRIPSRRGVLAYSDLAGA